MAARENSIFCRPSSLTQTSPGRKSCDINVRKYTNYLPFLSPMIVVRWDVVFLQRMRIIRISLRRVWVSRKSVFFCEKLSICWFRIKYLWWFWGSFASVCWFFGPAPPTLRRSDEAKCVDSVLGSWIRPSRNRCALNFAWNRSRAGTGPDR